MFSTETDISYTCAVSCHWQQKVFSQETRRSYSISALSRIRGTWQYTTWHDISRTCCQCASGVQYETSLIQGRQVAVPKFDRSCRTREECETYRVITQCSKVIVFFFVDQFIPTQCLGRSNTSNSTTDIIRITRSFFYVQIQIIFRSFSSSS